MRWAAEQDTDMELRFHARYSTGLLKEDLSKLPLNDQIKQWRDTVAKGKGALSIATDPDAYVVSVVIGDLILEAALESIPYLTTLLERDPSEYVREEALNLLRLIESCRMRLRGSEVGRRAIQAMKNALESGGLKPVYEKKEFREKAWKDISAEVLDDQVPIYNGTTWSVVAMAFEKFYGEKVTKRYRTVQEIVEATPEMRRFVAYLTNVDPYFPSWEYAYTGLLRADEVLHPLFKKKIARYYEQWKKFKAEQFNKK